MSRATKRKHVLLEVLQDDFSLPTERQQIVKVLNSRGNNLHEVQSTDGSTFLVSMPTKFRKNVWVKRNDFILVEPIEEGDKVKGEIVRVLSKDHVKHFRKEKVWPKEFDQQKDDVSVESDDDLFVNTNRPTVSDESNGSDESSDDSQEESGDGGLGGENDHDKK